MEQALIKQKMTILFGKITESNYVMDSYYTDGLIKKLASLSDSDNTVLEAIPELNSLIGNILDPSQKVHESVKTFMIRVIAIILRKELNCLKLFCRQNKIIIDGFMSDYTSKSTKPSLKVAYMEVALALVTHNSGVTILLESNLWKEILSFNEDKTTVFILRNTYSFASRFLWMLNDKGDENKLKTVVSHILKPIVSDIDFLKLTSVTSELENEMLKTVEPILQILMMIVSEENRLTTQTALMRLLINDYNLVSYCRIMKERIRSEDTVLLLSKIEFLLTLAKILPEANNILESSQSNNVESLMDVYVVYINSLTFFIARRAPLTFLDYCHACNSIWVAVWKDKKPILERYGTLIDLQNYMVTLCLVPLLVYVCYEQKNGLPPDLFATVLKIVKFSGEWSKMAYKYRELLDQFDKKSLLALQSVKRLSYIKSNLTNEQANIVFQALFYTLREVACKTDESEMEWETEESQKKAMITTYVLDAVLVLVKNHNINWKESIEVLSLYVVVNDIIQKPNLPCKLIVTALNIIVLIVKKFLHPNLSLLMESRPGTPINELGKLIYTKMQDRNWEVRDSALELLLVCTEIAFIKFQSFQNQLLGDNLISLAVTIALHDHESYVKASALKCIAAATKMNNIWENMQEQHPEILDHLILILRNNDEGIVRKEACNVLCEVYQNLKTTAGFKSTLYDHMVSSAITDFHWEVQLITLKFWKIVILSFLTDQGMIDGIFPPVTFSRETRKIVSLNDTEIKRRLVKILEELASVGCLTVLVKLLYEDLEVEIMETALNISLDLLGILNQYKVSEALTTDKDFNIDQIMGFIEEKTQSSHQEVYPEVLQQENVIEDILNDSDVNILANIYQKHLNLEYEGQCQTNLPKIKLVKCVSPQAFISYLNSKDFKGIINQKKIWKEGIRSLPSLLDDVLGNYDVREEINSADCY